MDRKPKYLQSGGANRDRWVISYSDILTILLILFVAIAAQAFQDHGGPAHVVAPKPAVKERVETVVRSAEPVPPPPHETLIGAQEALRKRGIDPKLEARGLVISLPQAILFASGQDKISESALPMIAQIAEVLGAIPNKVSLVGHADAVPIHNNRFSNNWQLSTARSLQLLELLSSRYGIPEARLSLASLGSYSPKGPNETEDGRAGNRRVEIVILPEPAG